MPRLHAARMADGLSPTIHRAQKAPRERAAAGVPAPHTIPEHSWQWFPATRHIAMGASDFQRSKLARFSLMARMFAGVGQAECHAGYTLRLRQDICLPAVPLESQRPAADSQGISLSGATTKSLPFQR